MKRKDLLEFRNKKQSELQKLVEQKKLELALLSAKTKIGKEKNTSKLKVVRRDVAQILTILREMDIMAKEVENK
jgi:ribosomal protein L29